LVHGSAAVSESKDDRPARQKSTQYGAIAANNGWMMKQIDRPVRQ